MKTVAITQRVAVDPRIRRAARLPGSGVAPFLAACGLLPLPIPNVLDVALDDVPPPDLAGLVLTGRKRPRGRRRRRAGTRRTENALLPRTQNRAACRCSAFAAACSSSSSAMRVAAAADQGHVDACADHRHSRAGRPRSTATIVSGPARRARRSRCGRTATDGVIKAIRHSAQPVTGIMWHPERDYAVRRSRHRAVSQRVRGRLMRGLILAAGRGSRMGALGDDRPKCLVELDGRPLLDRQIAALRAAASTRSASCAVTARKC